MVWNVQAGLSARGIRCSVQNCYASGAIGDLSPFDAWPEVWIHDNEDLDLVTRLINDWQRELADQERKPWTCPRCGEDNEGSFDFCWHCGADIWLTKD